MKKIWQWVVVAALICDMSVLSSCSEDAHESQKAYLKVETETLEMIPGETVSRKAEANKGEGISYSSKDVTIATVDKDGLVTAVAEGQTTITVAADFWYPGCSPLEFVVKVAKPVVSMDTEDVILNPGEKYQRNAVAARAGASFTYNSSNASIASVNETTGEVTAVAAGKATISVTVKFGDYYTAVATTYDVYVNNLITGITLNKTELTLLGGKQEALVATVQPADATEKALIWTSDNESVATVDKDGVVTAVAGGTATITATANDKGGKTATCIVTVPTATSKDLADLTATEIGWCIASDGKAYGYDGPLPAGVTGVALVAYLGTPGTADASSTTYRGLAIALKDAGNAIKWCSQYEQVCGASQYETEEKALTDTAGLDQTKALLNAEHAHYAAKVANSYKYDKGVSAGSHPDGTSEWFLPSIGQWSLMMGAAADGGMGGADALREAFKDRIGTDMYPVAYWSSTEMHKANAWFIDIRNGAIRYDRKDRGLFVRPVLAF